MSAALAGAIDANGRLVVTGFTATITRTTGAFLVARFDANGGLDTTFGQGGGTVFAMGSAVAETGQAIFLDAQGRIVVAGAAPGGGGGVARLLASGALDTSFGTGGKTLLGDPSTSFQAVTLDAAGRITLAGTLGPSAR